jgi:hypothetical protein
MQLGCAHFKVMSRNKVGYHVIPKCEDEGTYYTVLSHEQKDCLLSPSAYALLLVASMQYFMKKTFAVDISTSQVSLSFLTSSQIIDYCQSRFRALRKGYKPVYIR